MTDKSEPAPSRSIARRLAAQKGEPVPEFTQQAPGQSAKSRQESRQSVGTAEEALREAHQQIGLLLKAFRDGHRDAMETVFLHAAIDAAVSAARREGEEAGRREEATNAARRNAALEAELERLRERLAAMKPKTYTRPEFHVDPDE